MFDILLIKTIRCFIWCVIFPTLHQNLWAYGTGHFTNWQKAKRHLFIL